MNAQSSLHRPPQQRVVRVFISSTFRDMQVEREQLVKRIFPQLRKLCEQRGVTWGEVDLRWGVTDEHKAEGKVLPICLEEIQRCRPYFIGLLGERYGWVPDEIPQDLIDREPWLTEHRSCSVTELEILHGVLRNPAMANHAFFYLRDPAYIDSLPAGERDIFREVPTPEEIEQLGLQEVERRAGERTRKLVALKQRLCASGVPVRENYPDPKVLGELVLQDLTQLINDLYPEGSQPDPLDREAAEHEAFAASRTRVYISRKDYVARLDAHTETDGSPLVVVGESGFGKSALLANWAIRYRQSHPKALLLMHFIGASPSSADWAAMLRRIMGKFKRRFDVIQDIPDRSDALRAAFAMWLRAAADCGRVVLIIDALNQLEDRDGALELVWLPVEIPRNVCLIVSTSPGRLLDTLTKRQWRMLEVQPLDTKERTRLISAFLEQYGKTLSQAHVARIAAAPQAGSSLYLRALLEELRLYGDHLTLSERIHYYLGAATATDLYDRILERYERDYGGDCSVRYALSNLWAARHGLFEAELLDLLGRDGEPLPHALWLPFYLAAESSLVQRSRLIGFSHQYFRQAVEKRYLPTESERLHRHQFLAFYFATDFLTKEAIGPRMVDECPWQLVQAKNWDLLGTVLADPRFIWTAWLADHYQVITYWNEVEQNSPLRMVDALRPILDAPRDYDAWVLPVARILDDAGHLREALALREYLLMHHREEWSDRFLALNLGQVATLSMRLGDLERASASFMEEEHILRRLGDESGLASCLGNQAYLLRAQGDLSGAIRIFSELEQLFHKLDDKYGISATLHNLAAIDLQRGHLDKALSRYREEERLCRELNDTKGIAKSLVGQSSVLEAKGDLDGALTLCSEAEQIFRRLGDKLGVAQSLNYRAVTLIAKGLAYEAQLLLKEMELISTHQGAPEALAVCLANQAKALLAQRRVKGALGVTEEAHRIASAHGLTRVADEAAANLSRLRSAMGLGAEQQVQRSPRKMEKDKTFAQQCAADWWKQEYASSYPTPGTALCDSCDTPIPTGQGYLCNPIDVPSVSFLTSDEDSGNLLVHREWEEWIVTAARRGGLPGLGTHRVGGLPGPHLVCEKCFDHRPYTAVDSSFYFWYLAVKQQAQSSPRIKATEQMPVGPVHGSTPHPAADPERASRLNIQYQKELARWKALPLWKRIMSKKPQPPTGI